MSTPAASELPAGLVAGPWEVDRICYTDRDIYALEQARIFARTWQFVAHDSELQNPGDFRSTELAGQPVLAVRGQDGALRLFLNSCRHKGTMLVAEKEGCSRQLRCPYHHWTYDTAGKLLSVPKVEAYGQAFRLEDNSLVEVPRFEKFAGMWFANLDADAPLLENYLGPAASFLSEVGYYSGEELVSLGSYHYSYEGNWKLLMENTLDDYHAEYLHDYAFAQRAAVFGMQGTSGFQEKEGSRFSVELDVHGAFDQCDDVRTLKIQTERERRIYLGIFPSFIALYNPVWDVTSFRVMEPAGVDRTRVLTYCLAPKSADQARRQAIGERFHYSWGPGGRAGVDDIVMFSRVQKGLMAQKAGRINISRGIERPEPLGGPADDHAVRAFWKGWRRYMMGEAASKEASC